MIVLELFFGLLIRFLAVAPFILLFWWMRRTAKKETPRQNSAALEFPVSRRFRILLLVVIVALVALILLTLSYTFRRGGLYAMFIPMSVLIAILAASPMPVTLDESGIRQGHWLGGEREIPWAEIASMKRGPSTGCTYIKSRKGGVRISFSPLLVGQSRFEHEVRARRHQISDEDE
jgi:uncharacterized Tic20 family protein